MDIAITGSGGLIGTALSKALTDRGDRVLSLTRSADKAKGDPDAAYWSPSYGRIDAGALEGVDAVIHLAGEPIADKRCSTAAPRAPR